MFQIKQFVKNVCECLYYSFRILLLSDDDNVEVDDSGDESDSDEEPFDDSISELEDAREEDVS